MHFGPPPSCSVGIPYSAGAPHHELRPLAPTMCDPSAMATSCSFPSGQTVDMGGVEAQVIGQWGGGFIVAVPADQPVPNTAWITPVPNPSEYTSVSNSMPMGAAVGGGAVSSSVYPNYASQVSHPAPSAPMSIPRGAPQGAPQGIGASQGFYTAPQQQLPQPPPPEIPEATSKRRIPDDAKVFVHSSDGGLRAMGGKSKRENPQSRREAPRRREQQQVLAVPSQSLVGLEDAEGHAVKIFVHDSDGVLHHVAECSQGTGGFEVDVLEDLEEDWREDWSEQRPASEGVGRRDGYRGGIERHDGRRKLGGLYGDVVNAWNVRSGGEQFTSNKPPSVASSNGSTTAESWPSPDQSGGESGIATPTPGEGTSLAQERVRALVACGAPSAPPPPPPPPCEDMDLPRERLEQASKAAQSSRKAVRARGKVAASNESAIRILQATEARLAPSPAPVLPTLVALKARAPVTSSELSRSVLTHVYRRLSGEIPAVPQKVRPNQSQKTDKSSRTTVTRRPTACREEPRRAAPEPSDKRPQRSASNTKQSSVVKRPKQAKSFWARQRRRVLDFLSAVKSRVARTKKAISIHGSMLILASSIVFLVIATVYCFTGASTDVQSRRSTSMYSYLSESPYDDSALGSRRVGALQKRLDVESARALAAVRQKSIERPRKTSKSGKSRKKYTNSYDSEAYAAWREEYLMREQSYMKGLKEHDPELANLLEMAYSSNGRNSYEDYMKMAAAYDKLMLERYGEKYADRDRELSEEDSYMADRINMMMQQRFSHPDMYNEGAMYS